MESNWIAYINTMMEYYLGIDPDNLTDEEWGEKFAILNDIRRREAKAD